MITLVVDGISYQYPQVDDEDWGNQATLWASSVSDVLATLRSPSLPTADEGAVRLGNGDFFAWRNFADTDNVKLYVDVDDKLYVQIESNPPIDLTSAAAGNVTGPLSSTDNALPRFDGTTGQIIQDSSAILDDSANLSGLASLDSLDITIGGNPLTDLLISVIGSSTDNALVRWDGATGKLVQDSGATLSDAGLLTVEDISINDDLTVGDDAAITGDLSFGTIGSSSANKVIDAYTRSTGASVGVRGVAISSSCGTFTTTSASEVDITNLSVTIITSGRPIFIGLIPNNDLASLGGDVRTTDLASTGTSGDIFFERDSTVIGRQNISLTVDTTATENTLEIRLPCSSFSTVDFPAAGTYTYKAQASASTGDTTTVFRARLIAYEL